MKRVTCMLLMIFLTAGLTVGFASPPAPQETEAAPKNPYAEPARTREDALRILRKASKDGDLKLLTGRDIDLSGVKAEDFRIVLKETAKGMLYRLGRTGKTGVDWTVDGPFRALSVTVSDVELFVRASCGNPGIGTDVELEGKPCPPCEKCSPPVVACPDCPLILAEIRELNLKIDKIEVKLDTLERLAGEPPTHSWFRRNLEWEVPAVVVVVLGILEAVGVIDIIPSPDPDEAVADNDKCPPGSTCNPWPIPK